MTTTEKPSVPLPVALAPSMMSSKPEMGKVYQGYTLVSFNETTSPLGSESICVRLVAPGNDGEAEAGRRVKFYVNGYEKQDFERFNQAEQHRDC